MIDHDELKRGLVSLGIEVSGARLDDIVALLDKDHDGSIDYAEFARCAPAASVTATAMAAAHPPRASAQLVWRGAAAAPAFPRNQASTRGPRSSDGCDRRRDPCLVFA